MVGTGTVRVQTLAELVECCT